ncbi:MAG: M61 family metallopeptidase, partial [Ferruginibacter sp.]|nr:M61 family metallopeptidase [Cytophagales bacterium]
TPGSYLIREYAKNVEGFVARDGGGNPLASEKINKNTWRVRTRSAAEVRVAYQVYAYELTVRTSFLDASHGYLNGASVFMYVDKMLDLPATLTVKPYAGWTEISTSLTPAKGSKFEFDVPNYDILVDSPLEIGTHRVLTFTAAGVPHRVAMYGQANYDANRLLADMKKIAEEATTVVGEHPCKDYTFLVHNLASGGGGLEHLSSTTLQTSRTGYQYEPSYTGFLTLVAHEYFHLWNVKRIRPKALGPFDYENENYTHLLWVAEGFTSFYEDYLLRRAGLTSPDQYLNALTTEINGVENAPGNRVQSVAESSWDAWIKYYRPNENSPNTTVSYYSKGSVLGNLLNLTIMQSTGGGKSLDDAMRYLWTEYHKKQQRGFTDEEFQKALEMVAGKSLAEFFQKHVFGTEPIDYNRFFNAVGLQLVDLNRGRTGPYLGVATSPAGGKLTVTSVMRGTGAYQYGLNVNDELISLDGTRLTDDINRLIAAKKVGDTVKLLVNRGGELKTLDVTIGNIPTVNYRLERVANPTAEQTALYRKWLRLE